MTDYTKSEWNGFSRLDFKFIGNRLKPILMKALLFGKLKKSGKAHVDFDGKELVINY